MGHDLLPTISVVFRCGFFYMVGASYFLFYKPRHNSLGRETITDHGLNYLFVPNQTIAASASSKTTVIIALPFSSSLIVEPGLLTKSVDTLLLVT
jgi:hypothetical protein